MGLYLVKMVVDLHGGEVSIESEEGKGSRFKVRLPVGLNRTGLSEFVRAHSAPIPADG